MNSTTAKKLSAILASIALVLTGTLFTGVSPSAAATQPRGEVNYGPLRFPTPKQVGLGNGWKVKTAAIGTGNYVSKSCRVATKCTVLSWAGPSKIGIFQTAAFRMSKPDVKFLVDNYKRQAREKKIKIVTKRTGKTITYSARETNKTGTTITALSVYNQVRVGQAAIGLEHRASKTLKRNGSVDKTRAIASYLSNPANGRVSKVKIVPN